MNHGTLRHISHLGGALCFASLVAAPQALAEPTGDCDGEGNSELSGTVAQVTGTCPKLRFKVGATNVIAREKTSYDDGTCRDVRNGRRVEVTGKLSANGTMTACSIELKVEDNDGGGGGDDDDDNDTDEGSDEGNGKD